MFSNELREALVTELPRDNSREARRQLCRALAAACREAGQVLWTGGFIIGGDRTTGESSHRFGSDATAGLGTVTQVAGELCTGIVQLLEQENTYSAAALLRQIVEVEYLAWAFAEDSDEAAYWMRANREERLRMWQPHHIRQRSAGRFRAADYHRHCEVGGHPTLDAMQLLADHRTLPMELLWLELAHHGISMWRYVEEGANGLGYKDELARISELHQIKAAIGSWERQDRLSKVKRKAAEQERRDD